MKVKNIRIEDFDYPLPDERIARHPLADRESCLLLTADDRGATAHHRFGDVVDLLPADTLLVCNDTRVINARIGMRKATGSHIEIFLLEPLLPADYAMMFQSRHTCEWNCLVGNRKRWKNGPLTKELEMEGRRVTLSAELLGECPGNSYRVRFSWDDESTWASIVDAAGRIPIPPYLNRDTEPEDSVDYQTVYARIRGSVAAPTAGLHFTDHLLDALHAKGVRIAPVTLHVGAGTFQPVKSEEIGGHPMHTETFTVTLETVRAVASALREERPVTAVGTTSVRTLESLPLLARRVLEGREPHVDQWEAYDAGEFDTAGALESLAEYMERNNMPALTTSTAIMIAPGFRWRVVDSMITNFHQPQSTLLLLVSSFLGTDENGSPLWRCYYDIALAGDYRFLSYGDACLFRRSRTKRAQNEDS